MKKLILLVLMMTALSSCGGSASSNSSKQSSSSLSSITSSISSFSSATTSSSSSSSSITLLEDVERISPTRYEDRHSYKEDVYASFPNYNEASWNTSLKFTLSADETYYIVSDYLGADRLLNKNTLIIPAYYKGLPVEEIAQAAEGIGAFSELTWLENVYLPHTIKRIGYGTFSLSWVKNLYIDCESLEDFNGRNWVFYPPSNDAYEGMNVYFGPNVKRIPERLFYPNVTEPYFSPKINNVYFDKDCQLEEIGAHAFHDVTTFRSIYLPNSVKTIGDFAFYKTSITELVLPSSLEYIGNDAFEFSKLINVKFNDKLTHIGDRAFAYTYLDGADLSNTKLNYIEDECFAHSFIKEINLPESLKDVGQRAFLATKLTDLFIPDNVEIIREEAFANTLLERIYLGTSLKQIDNKAFYNTTSLVSIEVASIKLNDFNNGNHIFTNAGQESGFQVYVLEGVTYLPSNMFFSTSNVEELPNLKVLSIPSSVNHIGSNAFYYLDIDRVNYRGTIDQYNSLDYKFDNLDIGGKIYA